MKNSFKVCLTVLTLALVGVRAADAQTPAYSFTKIHFPGAYYTEPFGINNSGHVAGTFKDAAGVSHAFVFDGTNYTELRFPNAIFNYALGIANSGEILGSHSYLLGIGPYHAFLIDGGNYVEFDYPGMETDARAMNASGQIVGIYNSGYGTKDFGFLKTGDTYTSIDVPGATFTYAFGLNDAGIVTGTYRDSLLRLRGFSYVNGLYKSINFPNAIDTYLGGVNNQNTAVGWSTQGGITSGYIYSGGMSFRPLSVPFAGASNTKPRAINDLGEIIGTYTSAECPVVCGFIARPIPGGIPACNQSMQLTYEGGILHVAFTVATTVPTNWTTWLFLQNVPYRLWSVSLPVLQPGASGDLPIAPIPPSGNVLALSILSTPSGRNLCADYSTVNTGAVQ